MLTAKTEESDRVAGLENGADDYITKPFSPRELLARIQAVLRRGRPQASIEAVTTGSLKLDPTSRRVTIDGGQIGIGPTEFRLLHFLMTHPDHVHSRDQLLDQVWGDHVFIEERTVDVHIRRLRAALEPTGFQHLIQTVRGCGYRFSVETEE
jgi:two-component system phosphate regulon response regulator PhoB